MIVYTESAYYASLEDAERNRSMTPVEVAKHFFNRAFDHLRVNGFENAQWEIGMRDKFRSYSPIEVTFYPYGTDTGQLAFTMSFQEDSFRPPHAEQMTRVHVEKVLAHIEAQEKKDFYAEHAKPWDLLEFFTWVRDRWWGRADNRFSVQVVRDSYCPQDHHVLTSLGENKWKLTIHPADFKALDSMVLDEISRKVQEGYFPWGIAEHNIKMVNDG